MMDMFEGCLFDRDLEFSGLKILPFVFKISLVVEFVKGALVIFITVFVLETSMRKVATVTLLKVSIMISLRLWMGQRMANSMFMEVFGLNIVLVVIFVV